MTGRRLLRIAPAALFLLLALLPAQVKPAPAAATPAAQLARPDVFPIGVWLQDPVNAAAYRALGINFYAGLWKGPTERQLDQLRAAGMAVFTPQTDLALAPENRDIIAGWIMPDEPDNAQRRPGGWHGPPLPPEEVVRLYESMKARDPSRPILLNLGQGVAWDHWHGRGTRTNHPEDYVTYVKGGDILSFDIYPVSHNDRAVRGRLDFVARGVDRLLQWSGGNKPVWSVIEAGGVPGREGTPDGEDVRRLVWLSIIHGARGIIYFAHQFRPTFVEASLLRNERLMSDIAALNARLQSLAPVLNSPPLAGVATIEPEERASPGSIAAIARADACHLYLFAGSISRFAADADIYIRLPDAEGPVDVLDEGRQIPLRQGMFSDRFGPYGVHLYRLRRGGASCPS